MCSRIIRVTYIGNDVQSIDVRDPDELDNKVADLQAKNTVLRIEVFGKTQDIKRTTEWKDVRHD